MQTGSRTIVGIFTDISDAKRATDELRSLGISSVRLVENDQDVTFTGTAERQGASSDTHSSNTEHKKTGIGAFFARLFGFEDDKPSWSLNRDSEAYFQDAYNNRHHLVIVEDCNDVTVCREVITRFGGNIEDQGGRYYETERFRDQGLAGVNTDLNRGSSLSDNNNLDFDRDTSLSGSRMDMDQSLTSSTRERNELFGEDRRDLDRDSSLTGNRLDNRMDLDSDSDRVMELREEQLDVQTERMQTGEVQLRKEIITENRTVEVPVTREEIVVERRPLEGAAREGSLEASDLDADRKEIRIPVSEEFVHIDKKVVPREEVRVSKEKITDTKTVSEEVRREEAQLESDGRVNIKDRSATNTNRPLSSTRGQDSTIQPGV